MKINNHHHYHFKHIAGAIIFWLLLISAITSIILSVQLGLRLQKEETGVLFWLAVIVASCTTFLIFWGVITIVIEMILERKKKEWV